MSRSREKIFFQASILIPNTILSWRRMKSLTSIDLIHFLHLKHGCPFMLIRLSFSPCSVHSWLNPSLCFAPQSRHSSEAIGMSFPHLAHFFRKLVGITDSARAQHAVENKKRRVLCTGLKVGYVVMVK
jgi:hypothetical protein